MEPRISLITLGVDDLDRSVKFYTEGLGLKTEGIVGREFELGAVVFFGLPFDGPVPQGTFSFHEAFKADGRQAGAG